MRKWRKIIKCCKNKDILPVHASQKPPEVQVMEMIRKSMKKCNRIKHTVKKVMHRLSVTASPETTQSYILLSYLEEKEIYQKLFNKLQSASMGMIKFYMSMVLPLYSENMVLSPALWDSWGDETKLAYIFYANLKGKVALVYSRNIGMGIRNTAKCKNGFDLVSVGK